MGRMLLAYGALDVSELQGRSPANVLVQVDADFRMVEGRQLLFAESGFPVVELALSLLRWDRQEDFDFDSMSYEEKGAVQIHRDGAGWVFGSAFEPHAVSAPIPLPEVDECIADFVAKVRADLSAAGLDPDLVS